MKIGYVTSYDVFDRSGWSKYSSGIYGAGYRISKALEEESIKIDHLGPLDKKISLLTRVKWIFYHHLYQKDYYRWAEPLVLKNYARQISKKLALSDVDVVLSPENPAIISELECKQPLVLWVDTTLAGLVDFYPWLSNLCQETQRNLYTMERAALSRCKLIILSSDWAAQTAIETYDLNPAKVKVIPRGGNVDHHQSFEEIKDSIDGRLPRPCKLLFIGVDWFRKGGHIALEVTKKLNELGLITELTVVGCKPITNEPVPNFVKSLGYIDKSQTGGQERIKQIIAESHFLILPASADCTPNVLVEANAFGVPCVTTNTGGIPTLVKDSINGRTFSLEASTSDYCDYVFSLMENYGEYKRLALSAFNEYQSRLHWSVAGRTAKQLLTNLIL